jgi:hypothetical protein
MTNNTDTQTVAPTSASGELTAAALQYVVTVGCMHPRTANAVFDYLDAEPEHETFEVRVDAAVVKCMTERYPNMTAKQARDKTITDKIMQAFIAVG